LNILEAGSTYANGEIASDGSRYEYKADGTVVRYRGSETTTWYTDGKVEQIDGEWKKVWGDPIWHNGAYLAGYPHYGGSMSLYKWEYNNNTKKSEWYPHLVVFPNNMEMEFVGGDRGSYIVRIPELSGITEMALEVWDSLPGEASADGSRKMVKDESGRELYCYVKGEDKVTRIPYRVSLLNGESSDIQVINYWGDRSCGWARGISLDYDQTAVGERLRAAYDAGYKYVIKRVGSGVDVIGQSGPIIATNSVTFDGNGRINVGACMNISDAGGGDAEAALLANSSPLPCYSPFGCNYGVSVLPPPLPVDYSGSKTLDLRWEESVEENGKFRDQEFVRLGLGEKEVKFTGWVADDDGCGEEYLFTINGVEHRAETEPFKVVHARNAAGYSSPVNPRTNDLNALATSLATSAAISTSLALGAVSTKSGNATTTPTEAELKTFIEETIFKGTVLKWNKSNSPMSGDVVKTLQKLLADPTVKVTGLFQEATENAVERFQQKAGITVTGKIDFQTGLEILAEGVKRIYNQGRVSILPQEIRKIFDYTSGSLVYLNPSTNNDDGILNSAIDIMKLVFQLKPQAREEFYKLADLFNNKLGAQTGQVGYGCEDPCFCESRSKYITKEFEKLGLKNWKVYFIKQRYAHCSVYLEPKENMFRSDAIYEKVALRDDDLGYLQDHEHVSGIVLETGITFLEVLHRSWGYCMCSFSEWKNSRLGRWGEYELYIK